MSPVFLKESFILSPNKCLTRWIENKLFVKDTRTTMAGQPAKLTMKGPLLKLIYLFIFLIFIPNKEHQPRRLNFPLEVLFFKLSYSITIVIVIVIIITTTSFRLPSQEVSIQSRLLSRTSWSLLKRILFRLAGKFASEPAVHNYFVLQEEEPVVLSCEQLPAHDQRSANSV